MNKSIIPRADATLKAPAPAPKLAVNSPAVKQQSKRELVEQKEAMKNQLYQQDSSSSSSKSSKSDSDNRSDSDEDNMQSILDKYEQDLNKSVISKQSKNVPG